MKVYLQPDTYSRGIMRVADALVRYMPSSVELVAHPEESDFEIIHVTGRHDAVKARVELLNRKHKRYAMIQYVLRSSKNPDCHDWLELWNKAELVWSYYHLYQLCNQDEIDDTRFHFYYAPLGVDPSIFKDLKIKNKRFLIGASSQHALSEGVRECAFAVKQVGAKMFFLGHELRRGNDIVCKGNLSDDQVALYWNQCQYISGLRRIEGFEFPVIEGALCGAKPIVFDRPEMRHWFNEFALFIPEDPRDQVIDRLVRLFNYDYGGCPDYSELIKDRFNWETIINNFWKKIL